MRITPDKATDEKPILDALRAMTADIAGLKLTLEHQSSTSEVMTELHGQLRQASERTSRLEAQLGNARTAEAKLADEVAKLTAKLSEMPATTAITSAPVSGTHSEDDVRAVVSPARKTYQI